MNNVLVCNLGESLRTSDVGQIGNLSMCSCGGFRVLIGKRKSLIWVTMKKEKGEIYDVQGLFVPMNSSTR